MSLEKGDNGEAFLTAIDLTSPALNGAADIDS